MTGSEKRRQRVYVSMRTGRVAHHPRGIALPTWGRPCPKCDGRGEVRVMGCFGYKPGGRCSRCHGRGRVETEQELREMSAKLGLPFPETTDREEFQSL